MKSKIAFVALFFFVVTVRAQEKKEFLTLRLERIDPKTNKTQSVTEKVPCDKIGLIVMDMWDAHWCKSWTAREAAMIPKMNKGLAAARRKGVQVIFSPSSVADFYKDYPQRKAVLKMPVSREYEYPSVDVLLDLDEKKLLSENAYHKKYFAGTIYEARDSAGFVYNGFPPLPPFSSTGACECADRSCTQANVWTRQNKDLIIGAHDLIVEGNNKSELFNICRAMGLTHLLYIGGAGNMCLTSSRETSTINMANRGLRCVYLEDLMISISGNGYNPDTKKADPAFTPEKGDSLVLAHLKKYIAPSAKMYEVFPDLNRLPGRSKPIFTQEQVKRYIPKGPAKCFRQICFDVNEKKVYTDSVFRILFSEQDPVNYARFCQKANLDAALLLAVPQSGYATYLQTKVNAVYPGMKGDFFGETLRELHKRGISGFGYIGIGWIMKYANEHPEYTNGDKDHPLICVNSPYRKKVMESSREVLRNYPVDGLRYDILDQPAECRCDGCKKLYLEMFRSAMPADWIDWQHQEKFRIESLSRMVKDLYATCKAIKPSVPVWQNWFNGEDRADIGDVNYVDMSYLEFADPFRELFLNGVFDKQGIITGKVIENPTAAWKCLALGGRCYSYFASVGKTGLPDADTSFDRIVPGDWFEKNLAPFYAKVRDMEPLLDQTRPVTNIAIVYNEKTRYHYDQYSRDDYMKVLRGITEPLLAAGNPVRFISNVNLATIPLGSYKALLLPESSGFSSDQLRVIRKYAERGGILLITGDALSYSSDGAPLPDFALSGIMGVSRKERPEALKKTGQGTDKQVTGIIVRSGQVTYSTQTPGLPEQPLVHVNACGKGFVYYIASSDMPELVTKTINHAGVISPVRNNNPGALALLSKKTGKREWYLHLLDKGSYSLEIDKKYCPATKVAATYPADIKNIKVAYRKGSIRIDVTNDSDYAAVILQ